MLTQRFICCTCKLNKNNTVESFVKVLLKKGVKQMHLGNKMIMTLF